MNRLMTAIRLTLGLPPVWIAAGVAATVVVLNNWQPFVDILLYAVQRLAQ